MSNNFSVANIYLWKFILFDFVLSTKGFKSQRTLKSKIKFLLKIFICVFYLTNMLLFGLVYGSWMFDTPFHIEHFIFGFFAFSQQGSAFLKFLNFYAKRGKIMKILGSVPQLYDEKVQENYKIKKWIQAFTSYKNWSMRMFYVTIILSLGATITHIYQKNFEFSKKLPFDTSNVYVHSLTIIWMNYAHITYQIINIVMEIFQYGLVTILSMEFRILAFKFENLKSVIEERNKIKVQNIEADEEPTTSKSSISPIKNPKQQIKHSASIKLQDIKPLVDKHNQLLELRDLLWNVLSLSFHIRFILSSFQLCFLAYQITASNEKYLFIAEMVKNLLNIFFQCYFGQMFKDAGHSIAKAVQRFEWETIEDIKVRRSLVMIIMRSQESIALRIIKTYEITVEQFTTILTSAYSYYTLCLQLLS